MEIIIILMKLCYLCIQKLSKNTSEESILISSISRCGIQSNNILPIWKLASMRCNSKNKVNQINTYSNEKNMFKVSKRDGKVIKRKVRSYTIEQFQVHVHINKHNNSISLM